MKFLVTGSEGFVGKHLVELLRKNGHETYGLSRHGGIDTQFDIYGNIDDNANIEWVFSTYKFDGVFHLAGLTHPPTSFKEPVKYFKTNAMGSINICEAILSNSPDTVLMQCSTPEVYGICPNQEIFEDFPLKPMNPYGVSKAAADLYILEKIRNSGLNAFLTRAGSHTGPGRPSNYSISSDAIQVARILAGKQEPIIKVGNLNSIRAVLDVRDVCNAYYKLMVEHISSFTTKLYDVYHVSGGTPMEIGWYLNKMLECFELRSGVTTETDPQLYRPIDIPIQILNNKRLLTTTDWKPEISIEQTLTDLVNYWRGRI